jgi:outer membrane protein
MRKKILIAIAGVVVTATSAAAQTASPQPVAPAPTGKIAYVNSQKIVAQAPGAVEARTTIEREMNKHQADLALADDSLKNLIAEFQKKQLALSADAREKQEADIRAKQQALQTRAQTLEDQMQKRQQDLVKPIMDRINTVLDALRKENGYTIIFDVSAGSVVSADPAADLTDTVLARLKAATPTAAAPKK